MMKAKGWLFVAWMAALAGPLYAQNLEVEELVLDNGMRFLFVPRKGDPHVSAGWIAKIGSVNEYPGVTGIAHLFEHMMFKGTHTIGAKDIEEELKVIEKLDGVRAKLNREEQKLIEKVRRGEIEDAGDPEARSASHSELIERFEGLVAEAKAFIVKDEFDRLYTSAGAHAMNAGTSNDYTIYYIRVPVNKLELWFWLESDRLNSPVFREFYSERNVVHEERRMRTDSTPTGKFREQFNSLFWQSSPYSWPVVGWPSDIQSITREDALSFYSVYYAPNNLTACLVGDLDVEQAKRLAERYFGRLKRGAREPEPVRTLEMEQQAEMRMIAHAETNPSATIRYHSVADGHVDEPALVILSQILNGRTGRLRKSLVLDQKIATSAAGYQSGYKWEGYFEFTGVARDGYQPEDVEQALYAEIDKLIAEPVTDRELQKAKNQELVTRFRRLQSDFSLMNELLIRDLNRSWRTIHTDPVLYQGVTGEDIRRASEKYFVDEKKSVAIYYRKEKRGDSPPSRSDSAPSTLRSASHPSPASLAQAD